MNRFTVLPVALSCLFPLTAVAQTEEPDTLNVRDLEEFVVEGRTQRVVRFGVYVKKPRSL